MRVLVTGAGGFIGGALLAPLAAAGHQVWAVARRIPHAPQPGVNYVAQDLAQPLDLDRFPQSIDAVIHQAALIHTEDTPEDAPFLVNVVGTWRVLNYAAHAGAQVFVHASTGGVYGCGPAPFHEDAPFHPMDLYSLTKSQAELCLLHTPGAFVKVCLRYFFPYGVGTPNPIHRIVAAACAGAPIAVTPDRRHRLNPIHLADTVRATLAALTLTQDTVLNIAGTENTTFAAIAEIAAELAGRAPNLHVIPQDNVIPYYRGDVLAATTRMGEVLGFTPAVPLARGIAEMVAELVDFGQADKGRRVKNRAFSHPARSIPRSVRPR